MSDDVAKCCHKLSPDSGQTGTATLCAAPAFFAVLRRECTAVSYFACITYHIRPIMTPIPTFTTGNHGPSGLTSSYPSACMSTTAKTMRLAPNVVASFMCCLTSVHRWYAWVTLTNINAARACCIPMTVRLTRDLASGGRMKVTSDASRSQSVYTMSPAAVTVVSRAQSGDYKHTEYLVDVSFPSHRSQDSWCAENVLQHEQQRRHAHPTQRSQRKRPHLATHLRCLTQPRIFSLDLPFLCRLLRLLVPPASLLRDATRQRLGHLCSRLERVMSLKNTFGSLNPGRISLTASAVTVSASLVTGKGKGCTPRHACCCFRCVEHPY